MTTTEETVSRKYVIRSVALAILGVLIASTIYYCTHMGNKETPSGATGVIGRVAWYQDHTDEFDLVFLGDSRTFCGVHPFMLDPILGTRSINLSQFAHWLPTQYPMIKALLPHIPKGTTVVWSVGHQNFYASTGIQRVYPVGMANALQYLLWNVPTTGLWDNVLYFNPLLHLFAERGNARDKLLKAMDEPMQMSALSPISAANAAGLAPLLPACRNLGDLKCVQDKWKEDVRIGSMNPAEENGKLNSIIYYTNRGSYYRVEIDHPFFRQKQREMTPAPLSLAEAKAWQMPEPDPGFWRLFEEILVEFKKSGLNVIVNEIEEAPFMYTHPLVRQKNREFMRTKVQKAVEDAGFRYTRINFDRLRNDDYFDYNHLNSKGAATFIPMLAQAIKPGIKREAGK